MHFYGHKLPKEIASRIYIRKLLRARDLNIAKIPDESFTWNLVIYLIYVSYVLYTLMYAIKLNIYIVIKSNIKLRLVDIYRELSKKEGNLQLIHNIRLTCLI